MAFSVSRLLAARGEVIRLSGKLHPNSLIALQVDSRLGGIVMMKTIQAGSTGEFALEFKLRRTVPPGVYRVHLSDGQTKITSRLLVR